jgi:serine/threonine protein kinase
VQPERACPDTLRLHGFAGGLLEDRDAAGIAAHVAGCERCNRAIQEFRTVGGGAGRTQDGVPADDSPNTVITASGGPADDEDLLAILQPSNDPSVLGRIGEYEVSRELGRGGMGVVFDAFDPVLHRRVAIKVLAPHLASRRKARQRFLREARASAAVRHPNVVTIHAVDPHAGLPYLVMEYVPGRTLRDRIRVGPIGLTAMLRIATQLAAGLAAAHGEGVIHRDVKPGNILLEDGIERVKISDFGLALVAVDAEQLSSGERPVGTPAYMSPEQVTGGKVDARSDLFSLGCVLYAMGAGNSPFQGANVLDIARRVTDLAPPPLHEVNAALPHFYSDIVARLLAKDPAERFQSAQELHGVLQEYLSAANQGGSEELSRPAPAPPPTSSSPARRRRWLPAAAVGIAALAIAVAGAAWQPWKARPSNVPVVGIGPPARSNGVLSVAQDGSADFDSIATAIGHAGPGSVVRVLDGATYDGPIVVTDAARGMTIEATSGAVIENTRSDEPVVLVDWAADVTLRGLRVRARDRQHAVLVSGSCEGLTLERVRAEVPPDSPKAAVFLWAGARGSADRPIVLRDSDIRGGDIGLVLIGSVDRPAAHVRLEGCRSTGPGVHVALHDTVEDVILRGNIFVNGKAGLSLAVKAPHRLGRLIVESNSFFGIDSWLALDEAALDRTSASVSRNLIVQCRQIRTGAADLTAVAASWFHDNWWRKADGMDEAQARLVASLKDRVPLLSEDPDHPDFMRLATGALPENAKIGARAARTDNLDPSPHPNK